MSSPRAAAAADGSPPAVADTFYYEVLGLPPSALPEDVRKAYKRLALQFHPDKNSAADATRSFLLVSEAYACLSDPARRAEYDRYGRGAVRFEEGGGGGGGGTPAPSRGGSGAYGRGESGSVPVTRSADVFAPHIDRDFADNIFRLFFGPTSLPSLLAQQALHAHSQHFAAFGPPLAQSPHHAAMGAQERLQAQLHAHQQAQQQLYDPFANFGMGGGLFGAFPPFGGGGGGGAGGMFGAPFGSLLASGAYESGSSSSSTFTSSNGRSTSVRTVTTVERGVKTTRTTRTTRDEHGREETTTVVHTEDQRGGGGGGGGGGGSAARLAAPPLQRHAALADAGLSAAAAPFSPAAASDAASMSVNGRSVGSSGSPRSYGGSSSNGSDGSPRSSGKGGGGGGGGGGGRR